MQATSALRSTALFLAVTWCSWPGLAIASPTYPGALAGALNLPCEPACTLCHTRATGGFGTVNTPFGRTARMREGLSCCSPSTLPEVLDALTAAETDSDSDGTPDIQELMALTDPNDAADVDLACVSGDDDSGCSVARVRSASSSGAWLRLVGLAGVTVAGVTVARVRGRRLA